MSAEGWVVAGGKGLRMGRDKDGVILAERPLLSYMMEKFRALGLRARVSGLREHVAGVTAEVIRDFHPGCGPLSGIETALAESEAECVLALGVDLPLLPTDFLTWILRRAEATGAVATVPRVGGEPQPLCSVYRREMLANVRAALAGGDYKLMHAVERSGGSGRIDIFDAETLFASGAWSSDLPVHLQFVNCNTPEDLALAEKVLCAPSML